MNYNVQVPKLTKKMLKNMKPQIESKLHLVPIPPGMVLVVNNPLLYPNLHNVLFINLPRYRNPIISKKILI
jgi:hypothetical protein